MNTLYCPNCDVFLSEEFPHGDWICDRCGAFVQLQRVRERWVITGHESSDPAEVQVLKDKPESRGSDGYRKQTTLPAQLELSVRPSRKNSEGTIVFGVLWNAAIVIGTVLFVLLKIEATPQSIGILTAAFGTGIWLACGIVSVHWGHVMLRRRGADELLVEAHPLAQTRSRRLALDTVERFEVAQSNWLILGDGWSVVAVTKKGPVPLVTGLTRHAAGFVRRCLTRHVHPET